MVLFIYNREEYKDNNIDVNEQLKSKNQEMLLNKKIVDLDTSFESLLEFFNNYSTNIASDINNRICSYKNIIPTSEQGKIMFNTITSFFFIANKKLKEIVYINLSPLKAKLKDLDNTKYQQELSYLSTVVTNQMLDYYTENISMLYSELNTDTNEDVKTKIENYLFEVITIKMINNLKDKFMYTIQVITNNNKENQEVIESINEKTIK